MVVAGVWKALKPGERFVAEFGGHGNVAAIVTAMWGVAHARGANVELAGPWYYPTVDEYTTLLAAAGFDAIRSELYPRPTPLSSDMTSWLLTFRKPFFDRFEGQERDQALVETLNLLSPSLCDDAGNWKADYVRLRVHAVKS